MTTDPSRIGLLRANSICRRYALLLCLVLVVPHLAFGQTCSKTSAFNCAYATDGSGGDIYAVDRTSGAVTKITTIKGTLNDIRVGADNMLYVTSNTAVSRLSESGSGKVTTIFSATKAIPGPFTGIRFSPLGDAYVNTPKGVYRIGPDGQGNHLIQISGPTFPAPVLVSNATSCSSSGGLAVWPTGDLLIACNSSNVAGQVLLCSATNGVVNGCTGQALVSTTSAITGLAVDAMANLLVANGNSVTQFACPTPSSCGAGVTLTTFTSDFPAYIEAAPYPPGLLPNQAGSANPPCNSGGVTIFVSTGDGSGKNGKVWTINTVSAGCAVLTPPLTANQLALVNTSRPAVGMGVASASRTLTKLFPSPNSPEDFHYGPFKIQITPENVSSNCSLQLTAQREAAAQLDAILAQAVDANNNPVPSRAIRFFGEQGWSTSFHGGYPASGCTSNTDSHLGITGALQYINPWIVLIDDKTGQATLDPIPSVYPGFVLDGVPGDPIKITNAGLFTNNARIVLVDRGFTVNNAQGYQFQGFLSPLVDPGTPSQNTENAGKSFVVKFNLLVNGAPISDTQGFAVVTGISVARLSCDPSAQCPDDPTIQIKAMDINPEGNSASPPAFNFVGGGQFHFNLDTNQPDGTEWCNGIYEVTANSDSFGPHTLQFEIVGAPAYPSCF